MEHLIEKLDVLHIIATDYHNYVVWNVQCDPDKTSQVVAVEKDGRWLDEVNEKIGSFSVELSGGVNFTNHVMSCLSELRNYIDHRHERIITDGKVEKI